MNRSANGKLFSVFLSRRHSQEKKQLETQVSSLRDRLEKLGLEFEGINNDRVRLLEEMDQLRKKMQALTQERDSAQRSFNKDVSHKHVLSKVAGEPVIGFSN